MEGNIPHKCLRTADIQALIFSQLTRHDCVQLSRTCISFYDQAMNVVWTEATSIVSLVRCMPRDALREFSTSYEGSQSWLNEYCTIIEFDRDPTPEDWRAFCKHAHRVKKFTEKDSIHLQSGNKQYPYPGPQYDLTPSARELVSRFICQSAAESGFSGLFPYARVLEAISFRNVSFPTYLPYLCGAGLQSFTLNFGLSDSEVENDEVYCDPSHLLPALRARWPNLHSIKISAFLSSEPSQAEDYVEAICTWITDLPHLQSFQADVSVHFSLIQVLSDLPLLHNMKLKGHNKATPHVVPDSFISSQVPRFRSLKELSLFTFNPDSPIPILRALKASRTLTHVDLVFFYAHSAPGSATEAPAAIEAISHLPSLESLDIHFANSEFSPETPSSVPVLSRPLLLPLFRLHRLRLLKLHGFFDIFISDEELRDVVAAWPHLESIDIKADDENTPFMVDHAPLTSLLGVQALYNGFPHLTKAALPVNDVLPMTGGKLDLPDARPRDFAMKELDLRFCPIDFEGFEHGSAEFMPMVIRVLFPRLENLKSCHDDVDVWTSVEDVDWAKQVQNDWKIYRDMEMAEVKQLLERKWEELSAEDQ